MKNKILFSILFATILFSCKKENNQPNNSNGSTTGTLYFQNTKIDPYIIYLDGANIGTLAAGTISNGYTVTSGMIHNIKSQQASGYIVYPTIYPGTATLNPGGSVTWAF
jgi:hypothetical protein